MQTVDNSRRLMLRQMEAATSPADRLAVAYDYLRAVLRRSPADFGAAAVSEACDAILKTAYRLDSVSLADILRGRVS